MRENVWQQHFLVVCVYLKTHLGFFLENKLIELKMSFGIMTCRGCSA
jgi:hypothetical protein